MVDKWSLFKQFWQTEDEEAVITDASSAEDYDVENAIENFQKVSKEITDITATLSASRSEVDDILQKLREAVTLAYSSLLDNKVAEAKKTLAKVTDI